MHPPYLKRDKCGVNIELVEALHACAVPHNISYPSHVLQIFLLTKSITALNNTSRLWRSGLNTESDLFAL